MGRLSVAPLRDPLRPMELSTLKSSCAAVEQMANGPLLILAGAGSSGKTRVDRAPHRLARLRNGWRRPDEVLAVTFTNKAAAGNARAGGACCSSLRPAAGHVGFDLPPRLCAKLLSREASAPAACRRDFTIYDSAISSRSSSSSRLPEYHMDDLRPISPEWCWAASAAPRTAWRARRRLPRTAWNLQGSRHRQAVSGLPQGC